MPHSLEQDFDPSTIAGNTSDDIKQAIYSLIQFVPPGSTIFAESIQKRLNVVELSVKEKADERRKTEARLVAEMDVTEDMLNGNDVMHGGCSAYLVDMCSSLVINVLHMAKSANTENPWTVSQSLNIMCHAPATLGERLRIICTTLTLGTRALTARGEIWSATNHRLVVSGTHVKMFPVTRSKM